MLILSSVTFLSFLISSRKFRCRFLGLFYVDDRATCKQGQLYFFLSYPFVFYFFSCFIALAGMFGTRNLHLVPSLREKYSVFRH